MKSRLFILVIVLVTLLVSSCSANAWTIFTYDLDSLCYMSTDVIEATIARNHKEGQQSWEDRYTGTVVNSIVGRYKPGDQIPQLNLTLYNPAATGQRCLLFLNYSNDKKDADGASVVSVGAVDMLLIDGHNRVRRYYQQVGLVADRSSHGTLSYLPSDVQDYRTVAEELATIVTKWAEVNKVRPLLDRKTTPKDVPALINLLRHREDQRDPRTKDLDLEDALAVEACSHIAALKNPIVAIDAMAILQNPSDYSRSSIDIDPFMTDDNLDYARSVLLDRHDKVSRRQAAVDALYSVDNLHGYTDEATKAKDRQALLDVAVSDDSPEPLRLYVVAHLDVAQTSNASALRAVYERTKSEELKFAIEKAFWLVSDDAYNDLYFSLRPAPSLVFCILRHSQRLPVKADSIALHYEFRTTFQSRDLKLTREYAITNAGSGKSYQVHLDDAKIYGSDMADEQVPLPHDLPTGTYRIEMNFRDADKVISTSHPLTVSLP